MYNNWAIVKALSTTALKFAQTCFPDYDECRCSNRDGYLCWQFLILQLKSQTKGQPGEGTLQQRALSRRRE